MLNIIYFLKIDIALKYYYYNLYLLPYIFCTIGMNGINDKDVYFLNKIYY